MRLFSPHALKTFPADYIGYARMAETLMDRLGDVARRDFDQALWVGAVPVPPALTVIKDITTLHVRTVPVEGDIDRFPFEPQSLDLIVICGTLDTVNDLPGALIQMQRALKPDGLFICALPGGESLHELRDSLGRVELTRRGGASPRVHPMIDLQTWAGLLQRANFALPVADAEIIPVSYRALPTLLRDLKSIGGLRTAERDTRFVGKSFWQDVERDYRAHHADADGHLEASFEILYGIGWGPADTQQKPLRPGSAKTRLADALNAQETPLPR